MEMDFKLEALRIYRDIEHDRRSAEKFESVCSVFRKAGEVAITAINPVAATALSLRGAFDPVTGSSRSGLPALMSGDFLSITDGRY